MRTLIGCLLLTLLAAPGLAQPMTDGLEKPPVPAKPAATKSFVGDTYSFAHMLGAFIDDAFKCFEIHMAGMRDNTVAFDGATELLDIYTNGTQPFVFEFETGGSTARTPATKGTGPGSDGIEIHSIAGGDLFPEGFEDPESGTPLTDACVEIGVDDTLDSDEPVSVVQANLEFEDDIGGIFGPFDISTAFSDPWNGRLSVVFPGFAGQKIRQVRLLLLTEPGNAEIFADGFESGNTASWTSKTP